MTELANLFTLSALPSGQVQACLAGRAKPPRECCMESRILIIDDDRELCQLLAEFLGPEGFAVAMIHDGAAALSHCRAQRYDAVVLDIMLPGMSGIAVLKQLRQFSQIPVLMLTARGEESDRIVGLELGADDYLPKPCSPMELAARLRAILRRSTPTQAAALSVGQVRLNAADRSASYAGRDLHLTGAEFKLLQVLLANAGEVVDKETLCEQGLSRKLTSYDRRVDVHVSHIRKKLAAQDARGLIVNVRGVGYQFVIREDTL